MKRSAIAVGLSTGLALFIASVWNAERRQNSRGGLPKARKLPQEQVHTWEGEGGNLAGVAPPPTQQDAPVHSRSTH
ncbi:hypothetical protein [Chitinimonas naiadis]